MSEYIEFDHVLVIGNGFDLSLCLPTSYGDFIESMEFKSLLANKSKVAEHLIDKFKKENWVDVENELITLSNNYSLAGTHNTDKLFLEEYKSLRRALVQYLQHIDYETIDTSSAAAKLLFALVERDNVGIINFNYTDSISHLLSEKKSEITHVRIHGAAKDRKIVFGVHDEARIKSNHVFLRKAVSTALYKAESAGELMTRAGQSVTIFGHSLGNTDYTQFLPFFSLAYNRHEFNIDIHYHTEQSYYDLYQNIETLTHKELQKFGLQHNFTMVGPELAEI